MSRRYSGAPYKRGNSWYGNIMLGGVRIHRKFGNTYKEAKENLEALKYRFRMGLLHLNTDIVPILFSAAAEKYKLQIRGMSPKTQEEFRVSYEKHLKPVFGDKYIGELSNADLMEFQAQKQAAGYANRSINIYIKILRKVVMYAQNAGLADEIKLKYPHLPEPKKHHAFLTLAEYDALKKHCPDHLLSRVKIARLTGMRPAELAYLTWADIDFKLKTAHIRGKDEWKPKAWMERSIPLSEKAIETLTALKEKAKSRWVFSNKKKPVICIRRALREAAERAGIKHVSPNMLRHTFATHALIAGADIESIADIMGHSTIKTTSRYTHAIKDHVRHVVESLDKSEQSGHLPQIRHIPLKKGKK